MFKVKLHIICQLKITFLAKINHVPNHLWYPALFKLRKNKWLSHGQPGYNIWLSVQVFGCPNMEQGICCGWVSQLGRPNLWLSVGQLHQNFWFWLSGDYLIVPAHRQPKFRTLIFCTYLANLSSIFSLFFSSASLFISSISILSEINKAKKKNICFPFHEKK